MITPHSLRLCAVTEAARGTVIAFSSLYGSFNGSFTVPVSWMYWLVHSASVDFQDKSCLQRADQQLNASSRSAILGAWQD